MISRKAVPHQWRCDSRSLKKVTFVWALSESAARRELRRVWKLKRLPKDVEVEIGVIVWSGSVSAES